MALDLTVGSTSSEALDLSCKRISRTCKPASLIGGTRCNNTSKMISDVNRHRAVSFQLPHVTSASSPHVNNARKVTTFCMLRKQRLDRKRKTSLEDSSCSSSEESDSPPAKRLQDSEENEADKPSLCTEKAELHSLPRDPRDWSRIDVCQWLREMRTYHIDVLYDLQEEKFPTNGKGLCLMNADMFLWRVPQGGALLYRDFRLRLHRALARLPTKA